MGYTPTVWQTGDIVSSEKLNKNEEGIAGAYEIVYLSTVVDDDTTTLNKTFKEVYDLVDAGKTVKLKTIIQEDATEVILVFELSDISTSQDFYAITFYRCTTDGSSERIECTQFIAESEDDYPVLPDAPF